MVEGTTQQEDLSFLSGTEKRAKQKSMRLSCPETVPAPNGP